MRSSTLAVVYFAVLSAAGPVFPRVGHRVLRRQADINPFDGKKLFVNPTYAEKLEQTIEAFEAAGDGSNAEKTRAIQDIGTFVWVSDIASLANIDTAIEGARAAQAETRETQIVGLVLYNLPDRDCSAGESAGELVLSENGLERYKTEYIQPYAEKVSAATDLTFAIVLEPDSLGNLVTNMNVEKCANAADAYKEGIAHAISSLQFDNVHLYIDAAHGGWLGWDDNLQPTAEVFGEVVRQAGNGTRIRGYATNVSNYNPFKAEIPEPYTEYSNSADESSYATSLSPYLEAEGLPTRFIIDQGRVALPGAREEWGEWCNVAPAGYGIKPGTAVENPLVDSIVWIKPGGESDGQCGMEGAPRAGQWFEEYAQMLVENADASITV
ncbi:1,4-beta-D-glucan cellobiohydrolase cel6b [Diaporthe eres]|uniref:Glucanase n=1 Tax=Diaporthe eres TaxID=83184 RepID=A0ABR1P4A1_DIAER